MALMKIDEYVDLVTILLLTREHHEFVMSCVDSLRDLRQKNELVG